MSNDLMKKAAGICSKIGFALKKRSPEILVTAGAAGMIVSTVLACKATTKASKVFEEHEESLEQVKKHLASDNKKYIVNEDGEKEETEYTPDDAKKDRAVIYFQTGVKVAKLYAPAVIVGTLSLVSIFASHDIMRKRGAALAAAYAAVDTAFKEYREGVVARFGEDVDKELRYKVKALTVKDENGDEAQEKISEFGDYSGYARIFDETNDNYEKDSEYNFMFLNARQSYANDLLKTRGYLFLNDVYDMLGFPRSKAGQIVGWRYDEDNPTGDNYVDFGLFDITREKVRDFVNGYERAIVLDFNVDGPIIDYI